MLLMVFLVLFYVQSQILFPLYMIRPPRPSSSRSTPSLFLLWVWSEKYCTLKLPKSVRQVKNRHPETGQTSRDCVVRRARERRRMLTAQSCGCSLRSVAHFGNYAAREQLAPRLAAPGGTAGVFSGGSPFPHFRVSRSLFPRSSIPVARGGKLG